ncbi:MULTISPECIES: DUF1240 domain-containing protein [Photorhabdus]|uniref:Uncharacterized protein DUF1240 n=2 Tax=Photorhabdus asymbiotica TaxID=291112 RepID=A0ABX9SJD9_9GAMM|nr:DUF1240 domain-containing protein [Photorhabdus asymbiotica]RKS56948.1 uncharacterized protein DUF1240 [Photorhabdus asymbiotica]CAQ84694.1 similar to putative membrane protein [Photorhabdus asymbiotica]
MTGVSECSQQRGNLKDEGYIIFFGYYIIFNNIHSLLAMKDEIVFSSMIFICFFSFPLILYYFTSVFFYFIFNRLPNNHMSYIKFLGSIMIISFITSLPISFWVGHQLKNDGYLVCDKISWMSPTTYVKDIKLCE